MFSERPTTRPELGPFSTAFVLIVIALVGHAMWIADPPLGENPGGIGGLVLTIMDAVLLIVHEAGHFLLMIFPSRALILLGGTAAQLAFPIAIGYLAYRERALGILALSALFWSASWHSSAAYIADAGDRALPLITGNPDHHDWGQLIYEIWDKPGLEDTLATIATAAGLISVGLAVIISLTGLYWHHRPAHTEDDGRRREILR